MSRNSFCRLSGAAAWIVLALISRPAWAGGKVQVGQPCTQMDRPSLAELDHGPFTALLQKNVDEKGLVAYAHWKASADDMKALDDYLARLGCVDLQKAAPKAAQIAFWINAYNALTLKGILREYPLRSIRDKTPVLGGYNIWKDLLLWVDNGQYSLDDIEHQILRKMGEPRIHAALVCGAKGCPPLAGHAYTAADLDAQLDGNGQRFFARPDSFRADPDHREVYVSPLLKWYGKDFGATPAEQLRTVRPLLPSPDGAAWMDDPKVRVKYLDYDWNLNDQNPPSR